MCTAVSYTTKDHYFGRNLDLEYSYHEAVTVTPRCFPFHFRRLRTLDSHYAMIGVAYVVDHYPLYYDATNEKGLSMAGLNFPDNACYMPEAQGKDNVTPFEFIPWVLGQCANVGEARGLLKRVNLVDISFSPELPLTPLHWMISDRNESIVVEQTKEGLTVFDDPVNVLTNNPPFHYHMVNLANYMELSCGEPENRFCGSLKLTPYSRGMGAMGLPGDMSSASRFVKAAFVLLNSVCGDSELESVSQFFHILDSVDQPRGCVRVGDQYVVTTYTTCCNADKGIFYYTTYENSQITGVDMHREDLNGCALACYPLIRGQQIRIVNGHRPRRQ